MAIEFKGPEVLDLQISDIRFFFDTRSVGVTVQIPLDLFEDAQNELAALSLIAKLIKIIPHLRDTVFNYKKLMETMRTNVSK